MVFDHFGNRLGLSLAEQGGGLWLAQAKGAAADDVDLSDYGTGTWSAWQAEDGLDVLALDLKGSTVVLQGASPDEVRALAEALLPAEDAASQE